MPKQASLRPRRTAKLRLRKPAQQINDISSLYRISMLQSSARRIGFTLTGIKERWQETTRSHSVRSYFDPNRAFAVPLKLGMLSC